MKTYRKELHFHISTRRAIVNITPDVQSAIDESGIKEGLVLVNPMHITASVFINDDERAYIMIMKYGLKSLRPKNPTVNINTTDMKTMPTRI